MRSIRDIQDRIAELARSKQAGEWIVAMPIGDPPFYFNVPDTLAEKRWPTRQELDAAAPNNPVYIRSIWGFWRGTFPLVSCANTEALKRAGITRDTTSPVETLTIVKDSNGDPTGVFSEREFQPIAELLWFRDATRFSHAHGVRALPQSVRMCHSCWTRVTTRCPGGRSIDPSMRTVGVPSPSSPRTLTDVAGPSDVAVSRAADE